MVVLAALLVVEGITIVLHSRRRLTAEIERGVDDALAIRGDGGRRQLLFAGNSLIFEGVDRATIQQSLGKAFLVHTAGVPGSTYDDWRYGLRSLFRRGAAPEFVVIAISPSQFLRPSAVTPLPVARLWRTREILAYYREQRPGLSTLSELLLEHFSTFFYMRDTFRIYVRKAIPGYESMVNGWSPASTRPGVPRPDAAQALFLSRLKALQAECKGHAQLMLLIVPTNQQDDAQLEPMLRVAAEDLNIPLIGTIRERGWPRSQFQADGYHLTQAAAKQFSREASAAFATEVERDTAVQR